MDINKILKTDYLDLLFEGRNKKYGSYKLRKKYKRNAILGAAIAFVVFIGFFLLTLINPSNKVIAKKPIVKDIKLTQPPPVDETKPPPPPPPANIPPPKVKPTVKFTPPVIKKDNEVKDEDRPEPPKPDKNAVVGPQNLEGSDDPGAINPNLNMNPGNGNGPVQPASPPKDKIFRFVDQKASFRGDLSAYLKRHVHYPTAARQAQIEGRVVIQFVVDQNGNISQATPLTHLGGGLEDAVIRTIKGMPKWKPAKNNGHPVKSFYVVPFVFQLQ